MEGGKETKGIWKFPSLVLLVVGATTIASTSVAANTAQLVDIDPITAISAVAPWVLQDRVSPSPVSGSDTKLSSDAGVTAQLPGQAGQGIKLTSKSLDLTIGLPQAEQNLIRQTTSGTPYYRNSTASSIVPVFKNDGSLQIISVSENASSPSSFEYSLQLPEGVSIRELPDGGYVLQNTSGDLVGLILAPWAVDANGGSVSTRYHLSGTTLTQYIDLGAPGISFPVVADPTIYYFWWGYGVKYTRSETVQIANAGSFAAFSAALCGLLPGPVKVLCTSVAAVFFGLYIGTFVLAKNQGKCVQVNYPYVGVPVPSIAYVVNC